MNDQENDLHELIERYNREMMAQYASVVKPQEQPAPSVPQETQSPEESEAEPDERIDTGRLQVRVSTENQAIPLPEAVITVTDRRNGQTVLIRTVITDKNGLTPLLDLPTKDRRLSLEPYHPQPYTTYTVDVTANGYFPKRFIDLPIYGGVTAVQNVSMIPLPENGDPDEVLSYPQGGPAL